MINRILLHKIGLFENAEIPLSRVNCIFGPNESGKSTIFDAACSLLCEQNRTTSFGKDFKRRYGDAAYVEAEGSVKLPLKDSNHLFSSFAFDSQRISGKNAEGFIDILLPESTALEKTISLLEKQSTDHKSSVHNKELVSLRLNLQEVELKLQTAQQLDQQNDSIRQQIGKLEKRRKSGFFSVVGGIALLIAGALTTAFSFRPEAEHIFFPLLGGSVFAMVAAAGVLFKALFSESSSTELNSLYSRLHSSTENIDALTERYQQLEGHIKDALIRKRASLDALLIFKDLKASFSSNTLGQRVSFWYQQITRTNLPTGRSSVDNGHDGLGDKSEGFDFLLKNCTVVDAQKMERLFDDLSQATKSAYLIAMRLAVCEGIKPESGILLFDDPCVHMDSDRTQKCLDVIVQFALDRNYQLLFFTKDTFIKDYFKTCTSIKGMHKILELRTQKETRWAQV